MIKFSISGKDEVTVESKELKRDFQDKLGEKRLASGRKPPIRAQNIGIM